MSIKDEARPNGLKIRKNFNLQLPFLLEDFVAQYKGWLGRRLIDVFAGNTHINDLYIGQNI